MKSTLLITLVFVASQDLATNFDEAKNLKLANAEADLKKSIIKSLVWKSTDKKPDHTLQDFADSKGFLDDYFEYYFII